MADVKIIMETYGVNYALTMERFMRQEKMYVRILGMLFKDESLGDLRRALALYRQSAQYTRRFFGENEEYGITCQNMRWVYERLGDREGAVAVLERAEAVYTRLFGAKSDRARAVAEDLRRLRAEAAL